MKRILIIPATVALLTGLSATAQDFNDSADAVKTPAPVLYTDKSPELDEMTIDELNALQLQRLQVAATAPAGTACFRSKRQPKQTWRRCRPIQWRAKPVHRSRQALT